VSYFRFAGDSAMVLGEPRRGRAQLATDPKAHNLPSSNAPGFFSLTYLKSAA